MFYSIYKITNQIDGKIYIGSHKTKDLNDSYMGSGKYLKYAQEKHGIENFTKEILFVFDTPDLMYAKEAELVNEEFIATQNTYNIKIGGFGGFDYINSSGKNVYGLNGQNGKKNLESGWNRIRTKEEFDKISKSLKEGYASGRLSPTFEGKTHSEETKKKISQASSLRESGSGNSQYGTTWIWHELIGNKKIKKDLLPEYLEQGWLKKYVPGYKF
jgi:hypothetical protein